MFTSSSLVAILAVAPAAFAAPAPQVAGGGTPPTTSFGPDVQVSASAQTPAAPPYPVIVGQNGYSSATYHGRESTPNIFLPP